MDFTFLQNGPQLVRTAFGTAANQVSTAVADVSHVRRSSCHTGQDCTSGSCKSGVCAAPTCTDRISNGDEVDVDYGGSCAVCSKACATSPLCVIGFIPINEGDHHLRLSYLHDWGAIFDVVADRTTYFAGDTLA